MGDKYEIRFSAIKEGEGIFTLPFDNIFVERKEPWVYNSDKLHRAIDYEIGDGWDSFKIRTAAPGTVVYKGYGWWSGNIIIISHDGQTENLYRTIYMHVRDGAENDCLKALDVSLPKLEKEVDEGDRTQKNLDDYNLHLEKTGCVKNEMNTNHYHCCLLYTSPSPRDS